VSLADKLDTIVGLFGVGERPTGSRDPYGLRRAAHGVVRILIDLAPLTGLGGRPALGLLLARAAEGYPERPHLGSWPQAHAEEMARFLIERLRHALESRGGDRRNVRAVTWEGLDELRPAEAAAKLEALPGFTTSPQFTQLATAFKRVKNISSELGSGPAVDLGALSASLTEPAEQALLQRLTACMPRVQRAVQQQNYRVALGALSELGPPVDQFFADVLVMAEDRQVRTARLSLMAHLRDVVRGVADVSEIVATDK
jgi:glycyl-tRNA synthetase beta chain